MPLKYQILDVFTSQPLAGNPLAVVDAREAGPLDTEFMQRLAAEFNLSETVFVFPPDNPAHSASLRIFTPDTELPFAGHPTVGAAVYVGSETIAEGIDTGIVLLEEKVGLIRAAVRVSPNQTTRSTGFAEFDLAVLPSPIDWQPEKSDIALALGLDTNQIGFENHQPRCFEAGVPYFCVPLKDLNALSSVKVDAKLFAELFVGGRGHDSVYMYTRETVGSDASFAARMMWPVRGSVREDPATGSAVATLAGAIMHFDQPFEGLHQLTIEQGYAMGRPSRISLELEVSANGALGAARLGGEAVRIAIGELALG